MAIWYLKLLEEDEKIKNEKEKSSREEHGEVQATKHTSR